MFVVLLCYVNDATQCTTEDHPAKETKADKETSSSFTQEKPPASNDSPLTDLLIDALVNIIMENQDINGTCYADKESFKKELYQKVNCYRPLFNLIAYILDNIVKYCKDIRGLIISLITMTVIFQLRI